VSMLSSWVYVHVMSDPNDDNYVGLYVGSSLCIGARIKEHERDVAAAKKWGPMPAKLSGKADVSVLPICRCTFGVNDPESRVSD
jgi:hypothetical protein